MQEPVDVVSLLVAIIAIIASKEVAHLVGPYAAICVLACAGSALALSGHEEELTNGKAIWFILVRVMVAVTLTVAVAEMLQNIVPWMKPRYTLVPLAFGIGWIRDYTEIRSWLGRTIDRITTRKIDDSK